MTNIPDPTGDEALGTGCFSVNLERCYEIVLEDKASIGGEVLTIIGLTEYYRKKAERLSQRIIDHGQECSELEVKRIREIDKQKSEKEAIIGLATRESVKNRYLQEDIEELLTSLRDITFVIDNTEISEENRKAYVNLALDVLEKHEPEIEEPDVKSKN